MELQKNWGKLSHPAHRLVAWYNLNHRELPWRKTKDPYRILVSETMLQQTRVETVIPYYHAFLERFPTVFDLAHAEMDEVLKLWQGLGYYSRARNLKKAAEAIVEQYDGIIPSAVDELLTLPGIGPYTAGAVASIAFDIPAPAVDGNVLRVVARYFGIDDPVDKPIAKRKITEIVRSFAEEEKPSLFTQSVMELGATVCTPKSPSCLICPLKDDCIAFATGKTNELPYKTPKKPKKIIQVIGFWLENEQGILLEKRPNRGLLAEMWQLPAIELADEKFPASASEEMLDDLLSKFIFLPSSLPSPCDLKSYVLVGEEKHIFTHIEWRVRVFRPVGLDLSHIRFAKDRVMVFSPRQEIKHYVLPRVYEKIIGSILGERVR